MSDIKLDEFSCDTFVEQFGGLYEHSSWVAKLAWSELSARKSVPIEGLRSLLKRIVNDATEEQHLALLQAHPELAGKAATDGVLTAESTEEQASARLDLCTQDEFEQFQRLNKSYNDTFGFPFILAVRGKNRAEILEAFAARHSNSRQAEFQEALNQVHQIASMRLDALLQSS